MEIDARKRNLLIKITKWIVQSSNELDIQLQQINKSFNDEDLKNNFYFKSADMLNYKIELFNENGILKEKYKDKIKEYLQKHYSNKDVDEGELKDIYLELKDKFNDYYNEQDKIREMLTKGAIISEKVHWKFLPIYMEQYIINNGYLPEENPGIYYNHFHAIEDLYRYIYTENKVNWKSTDGDINLEAKLTLKIYTVRWAHYDYYSIKRTKTGWYMSGLPSGTGDCKPNGEGALVEALEHDSVCYPEEGLKYAMEILWSEADTTEMKPEILQKRIDDISEWIKNVEIATHEFQPEWCGYY